MNSLFFCKETKKESIKNDTLTSMRRFRSVLISFSPCFVAEETFAVENRFAAGFDHDFDRL